MASKWWFYRWIAPIVILFSPLAISAQDSLTIHFDGIFDKPTRYLMIYTEDTICIQAHSGAFSSYYKVALKSAFQNGDTLPITFWKISSVRRKHHYYLNTGLKIMYLGGKELWISNDFFSEETFVITGKNEYLDYSW